MDSVTSFAPTQTRVRLIDQVNRLRASMAESGVPLTDMSRAGALETMIGADALDEVGQDAARPVTIARLESPWIESRPVTVAAPGVSRFRYFLDGSQKTVPICRIGLLPVAAALSAAAILVRDESGIAAVQPGSLRDRQVWIAPLNTSDIRLNHLIAELEATGIEVLDPFTDRYGEPRVDYQALVGDYGRSLTLAFDMAGRVRERLERDLALDWAFEVAPRTPGSWMVIDGRLPGNLGNAIGIVKSLQTQLLASHEAVTLFDLPQGHRTTGFRFAGAEDDDRESTGKTMWYMRLWGASGRDARHSLVRIEAPNEVSTTEQIDEISSWILSERLPRATDDPRWPTLLYPISYLERILKRRLAEITSGWPSA